MVKITDIQHDTWGNIIGKCNDKKVQWTYSVNMWFDDNGYVFPPYKYPERVLPVEYLPLV